MNLERITPEQCMNIAVAIDDMDDDAHRSTYLYDKHMQKQEYLYDNGVKRKAKFWHYKIIDDDNLMGFIVLRECPFGLWLFWESLYSMYRGINNNAKRAGKLGLDIAFKNGAKVIDSDVDENNLHSMAIHRQIDNKPRQERTIDIRGRKCKLWTFRMSKLAWSILRRTIK